MTTKAKEPVRLRQKTLANGNKSLYLDIYIDGARRYEFLKLYLVPDKTKEAKEQNKQTLALANSIKAQRIVEIQAGKFGFNNPQADKILVFDYIQSLIDKKAGSTRKSWENMLSYVRLYEKRNITFKDVTQKWCRGFRDYLDKEARLWDIDTRKHIEEKKPLKEGTKRLVILKLNAALNEAVRNDIIPSNPMKNVDKFSDVETERQYLTLEEVRKLAATECVNEELKRAFLFSCLTGLRWSDIIALRWSDVENMNGRTRLVFKQQKTQNIEYLDISDQAASFMGERPEEDDLIFGRFMHPVMARNEIRAWIKAAGINKHITFHCARHTFAVLMLDLGVDIYTLSKLLGHRCLETTEVYAKILDKNKQAAVSKIPNIFDD